MIDVPAEICRSEILGSGDSIRNSGEDDVHRLVKARRVIAAFLFLAVGGVMALRGLSVWEVRLELYDIQDLVVGGGDMGHTIGDSPDDVLPQGSMGGYAFAANVRTAILPGSWNEKEGRSIQAQSGLLIVRAPAYMHWGVQAYLLATRARAWVQDALQSRHP